MEVTMATIGFDDSILASIKGLMPNSGIPDDYVIFDTELIGNINSELSVLTQIGVGKTDEVFYITGTGETWGDFLSSAELLNLVPLYVALRVKVIFDPPKSTAAMDAINERAKELSFRIQDAAKRNNKKEEPNG
jgi:hypothetical protein